MKTITLRSMSGSNKKEIPIRDILKMMDTLGLQLSETQILTGIGWVKATLCDSENTPFFIVNGTPQDIQELRKAT